MATTRERQIFIVRAEVIDANYNLGNLTNFPKKFDSESATYNSDEDRVAAALLDATAEYDDVEKTIIRAIKSSGRVAQKCSLETYDGRKIRHYEVGSIPPVVVPDPEPEPETPTEEPGEGEGT